MLVGITVLVVGVGKNLVEVEVGNAVGNILVEVVKKRVELDVGKVLVEVGKKGVEVEVGNEVKLEVSTEKNDQI